jgi:hypothetical protein
MKEKRICSRCNLTKDTTEFPFRNKGKGTRHSYCLLCGRGASKNHYLKNVQYYVRKAHVRRKELSDELNGKLYEYLETHPCVDCGESDPVVLEFDHVRDEKSYNVSAMGYLFTSWNSLLREIAKCEVRCANCHRRKTAERHNSYRYNRRHKPLAQIE